MGGEASEMIKNTPPTEVWNELLSIADSALVDCRTMQEWDLIGTPDLQSIDKEAHLVEWRSKPNMDINPDFADQLGAALNGNFPSKIFFLCRSGARSYEAATVVQDYISRSNISCECINVAEGFEGDPGPDGQRGTVNGWKFNNLPWKQG